MKRPSPDVVKALATVQRQYPVIQEWLDGWCEAELETLPSVLQNTALAQGRCQVLKELRDLLKQSPEYAAQPNKQLQDYAHR